MNTTRHSPSMDQTRSETELKISKVFSCTAKTLFEAWITPDIIAQWIGADNEGIENTEINPVEGGNYHMEFVMPDGSRECLNGSYLKVKPFEYLEFTWVWERNDDIPLAHTLVKLSFKEVDSGTELTLEHSRFRDQKQRDMHAEGWSQSFSKLESFSVTKS